MSEHAHKAHPVPAVILVLILAGLIGYGISLMNAGQTFGSVVVAAIFALFGIFAVLVLGRE